MNRETMGNTTRKNRLSAFLASESGAILASFIYFTILPFPSFLVSRGNYKNALRYFPLVGWFTGGLCALGFTLTIAIFADRSIAILISMILATWITGALHEDGLADTFDGMGGGKSREKILRIMKDSSSGVYAILALLFAKALLFSLLFRIPTMEIPSIIIASESFSRLVVFPAILFLPYARSDESSRSEGVTRFYPRNLYSIFVPIATGTAPAIYFYGWEAVGIFIAPFLGGGIIAAWSSRKIGGYTGDILGAIQQIASILMIGSFVALKGHGWFL